MDGCVWFMCVYVCACVYFFVFSACITVVCVFVCLAVVAVFVVRGNLGLEVC